MHVREKERIRYLWRAHVKKIQRLIFTDNPIPLQNISHTKIKTHNTKKQKRYQAEQNRRQQEWLPRY